MSQEQETAMYDQPDPDDSLTPHGAHHDRSCVCWQKREGCGCFLWDQDCPHFGEEVEQALVDDEVTIGMVSKSPEFDLAMWFQCLLVGHKWKWLVRLNWPDEDSPLTYGISPVAERCKRCGSRRELNIFRWFEFVNGGPMWGAGPTP